MFALTPAFVLGLLSAAPLFVISQADTSQNATIAYTPLIGTCPPDFQLVRASSNYNSPEISSSEAAYIKARRSEILPGAWKLYVQNVKNTKNQLPDYVENLLSGDNAPTLGIAVSGGGYRAALYGAGVLNALDGRNDTAKGAGTGGLLQAATYLTGLSGGSWLVGSIAQADFPNIHDLVIGDANHGWQTPFDLLQPGGIAKTLPYLGGLITEVGGKHSAGFTVSIADVWSRALSRHFVTGTTVDNFFNDALHGAGVTFSSIAKLQSFTSYNQPFPIIVANLLSTKGDRNTVINQNDQVPQSNPIFEFNVYETGSFDPSLAAFTPTQYLGTRNTSNCVTGFDQASFVMATSAELFNGFNTSNDAISKSSVGPVIQLLNRTIPQTGIRLDSAYFPNPFFGVNKEKFISADDEQLLLVDGGEDGQVIPIQPLLVQSRKVDVIVAVDANGDGSNTFANGRSLTYSQRRARFFPETYAFPPIPESSLTFTNQNLATKPTFFGCSVTAGPAPLIIYLANGGPPRDGSPAATNTSTFQLSYNTSDVQTFLDQTFVQTTQGAIVNGQKSDPEWSACLACAVVDRARQRAGQERSGVCVDCFQRYCWSGTEATSTDGNGNNGGKSSDGKPKNGAVGSGVVTTSRVLGGLLLTVFLSQFLA